MATGKNKRKTEAQKEREAAAPKTRRTLEEPWVDVELRRTGGRWSVAQCYAKGNATAPDKARKAANRIAAALGRAS